MEEGRGGGGPATLFAGDGAARELARARDWSATPLGPVDRWSAALRIAVRLCMDAPGPVAIWAGPAFTLVHNDAYAPLLGPRHPSAMGRSLREIGDDVWFAFGEELRRVTETGAGVRYGGSVYGPRRGGVDEVHFAHAFTPIRDLDGTVVGVMDVCAETAWPEEERLETEERLRSTEQRLELLLAHANDVVWTMSRTGAVTYVSPSVEKVRGFTVEEALRQSIDEIHPPSSQAVSASYFASLLSDLAAGRKPPPFRGELEYLCKDGSTRWTEVLAFPVLAADGSLVELLGVSRDIHDRKRAEEQLQVASRLAALGTLVAGIAHEVNNPLSAAVAGEGAASEQLHGLVARLAGTEPPDPSALRQELEEVLGALADAQAGTQRIAAIVKDLTAFGRIDRHKSRTRLVDVVEQAMRWLPAANARAASIEVEDRNAPDVLASSGQLLQVTVNLVTNAAMAMPADRRGVIRIRVGPGKPGMARLEVEDDGHGMTPDVTSRIFDPFFTTRDVGQGMGLGLAVAHAIVTDHGGTIAVKSEAGRGSTFTVELPAASP